MTAAHAPARSGRSRLGNATGSHHLDVAAKADDVVEVQFFSQQLIQRLIAEAAIGDDADANPRRHDLRQADQHATFIEAAPVLEVGALFTVSQTNGVAPPCSVIKDSMMLAW